MKRLRWQIWIPRALAIVVLVLAAQYVLGLVVRSAAVDSSSALVGTRVEIGSSRVSLADRKVVLGDLRVIDPRSPADCLFEADCCELAIAPDALLQKRFVATRGQLSGLRLNAFTGRGAEADRITGPPAANIRWIGNDSDAAAVHWISQLAGRFQENRTDQLESIQRLENFCTNWSRTSAALEARGNELNDRVAVLQTALNSAEVNPLRGRKVVAELPQTIADLQRDYEQLSADLAKLPDQLDAERRVIVAARRTDEEWSHNRATLERIEANALSTYLLRHHLAAPLGELVDWLRWLREPALTAGHKSRGEDILFAGCRPAPNVLIQSLGVRGSARVAGQPVELRGMLTGLSNSPTTAAEPVRLRLTGTGSMPLELQVTIDRTRGAQRDAILVDCQGVLWQQVALGRSDQLAVTIGPSLGSLSVSVTVDGESLSGEIQMTQQNVRITPTMGGDVANVPMATSLSETLGRIDSLATRASLGGTLSQPTCTLWSNLGPAVAEAIERSLQKATAEHTRAMLATAGQQVDERLTTVEQQISEIQTRWTTRCVDARGQLHAIATTDVPRDRLSPDRLGRGLPTNSLFR